MTEEQRDTKPLSLWSRAYSLWSTPIPKPRTVRETVFGLLSVMALCGVLGLLLSLLVVAGAFFFRGEPMPFSNVEMVDANGNRIKVSAKNLSKLIKGIENVQEVRTYPDGSTKSFRFGDYYKVEEPAKP